MSRQLAYVVDDPNLLGTICGANDNNLKLLSDLLDSRVFTKGNEIYLETEDKETRSLFCDILEQMNLYSRNNSSLGDGYIHALYHSLSTKDDEDENSNDSPPGTLSLPGCNTTIFPANDKQVEYMKSMETNNLIFGIGPAGTGKTFLAVARALYEVLTKQKKRIILTRPVVEAGESLGYLPGDLSQKLGPYLMPLYDAIQDMIPPELLQRMNDQNIIEVAPLAYMRGRSLKNCFVVLDEAQNTTKEQMKMFLTRLGENSKAIVTGDITQIDIPKRVPSGLIHINRILRNIDSISFVEFNRKNVMRSALVKKIIEAYESEKESE